LPVPQEVLRRRRHRDRHPPAPPRPRHRVSAASPSRSSAAASATPPPRPPRSIPCWPTRSPTPRSALHAADGAGQRADRPCAEQARRNRVYLV